MFQQNFLPWILSTSSPTFLKSVGRKDIRFNVHHRYIVYLKNNHTVSIQLPVQSVPFTTKVVSSNPSSWRGVLDTTLYDKVCQWLAAGRWFPLPKNWLPKYNWNIVESGIKHHNHNIPNPYKDPFPLHMLPYN